MKVLVESLDGRISPEGKELHTLAGSPVNLYGLQIFTRMRARRAPDDVMRVLAMEHHLARIANGVINYFGLDEQAFRSNHESLWQERIFEAIGEYLRRGGDAATCYIHIGFGPFHKSGAMIRGTDGFGTLVRVESQGPLYGPRLWASSEHRHRRPWGPYADIKASFHYGDLAGLKAAARRRVRDANVEIEPGCDAETILYDRVYGEEVSEFGCSTAAALIGEAMCLSRRDRFPGITEQINVHLWRDVLGGQIIDDQPLTCALLQQGGIAMGTAVMLGAIPLAWCDGVAVPKHPRMDEFQRVFRMLWNGKLETSSLWTTVVPDC